MIRVLPTAVKLSLQLIVIFEGKRNVYKSPLIFRYVTLRQSSVEEKCDPLNITFFEKSKLFEP